MVSASSASLPLWNVYNLLIISILTGIASSLSLSLLDPNYLQLSISSGNYNWKCLLTTSTNSILQCPPQEECEVCATCDNIQCPPKCDEWKGECLQCDSQCPPNCEQFTNLGCTPTTEQCSSCSPKCDQCETGLQCDSQCPPNCEQFTNLGCTPTKEQCSSCSPKCDQCETGTTLCTDCGSMYKSAADTCYENNLFRCSGSGLSGAIMCISQIFFGTFNEAEAKCRDLMNKVTLGSTSCFSNVYSKLIGEESFQGGGVFDKCIKPMISLEPNFSDRITFYVDTEDGEDSPAVVYLTVTDGVPKGSTLVGYGEDSSVVHRYICSVKLV